jgi:hypothetical protein
LTGCSIDVETSGGSRLPTTTVVEWFVGRKTPGYHRISHRV